MTKVRGRRLWMWWGPQWKWNTWVQPWQRLFTRPVPRCWGWPRVMLCENHWCVCVREHKCVYIQCIYDGMPPRGKQCHMKVTLECRRMGRGGHLLPSCGEMRVTAIHLSENALIPDPICPPPLGYLLPRGLCDPHCCPLDQASCALSLQPAESATTHLWPEVILGYCNIVKYIESSAADVCCFIQFFLFCLKVIQVPLYVRLFYESPSFASSSQVANREGLHLLHVFSSLMFSKLKAHHVVL